MFSAPKQIDVFRISTFSAAIQNYVSAVFQNIENSISSKQAQ
jgi:hypothetical protein